MRKQKIISIPLFLVIMLMIVSMSNYVKANDAGIIQSTYILQSGLNFSISDDGEAAISAYVIGNSSVTFTYVQVTLQKRSGLFWTDIMSWETSSNSNYASVYETYPVSTGTYRILAAYQAGSETGTVTSDVVSY